MKQRNVDQLAVWEQRCDVQNEREELLAQLDAEAAFGDFVDRCCVFVTGVLVGFNFALLLVRF